LEEAEALQNIDAILAVEGVDVFFVGPSDLGQSMGYPGQSGVPEVEGAIDGAFATIIAAGKTPGTAGGAERIVDCLRKGGLYVYTHVPKLLASASKAFFEAVQTAARFSGE
jgi:4-hydroxy-2-oxoheptanedioate aldolase